MEKELGKHEDLGELKTHCEIAGKSGVPHRFSFGYEKTPEFTVVADVVVQDGPVDETKVLSLFIKVFDTGVKHSMLCVTPSLTPEAKKLAGLYRIVIVESSGRKNLPSLISEALNRISSM